VRQQNLLSQLTSRALPKVTHCSCRPKGVGASHQPIEHELRDLCLRTARIDLLRPAAQLPLVLPGAVIPAKQPFSFAGVEWSERQQKGLKCAF
jgi:hypothetical protein